MKLRKIITMGLAAIMAVSAMSISAFAAADTETLVIGNHLQIAPEFLRITFEVGSVTAHQFSMSWIS